MRLNKEVLTASAVVGIGFVAGIIAGVNPSKPNEPVSSEQSNPDSRLLEERINHCRDLVEALQNEASMIQSVTAGKETAEPLTCLQFKSYQDRRIQAKKVCSSLQKDLPQYCTDGPDVSSQIQEEMAKLANLPIDVEVDCTNNEPVREINCGCDEEPQTSNEQSPPK